MSAEGVSSRSGDDKTPQAESANNAAANAAHPADAQRRVLNSKDELPNDIRHPLAKQAEKNPCLGMVTDEKSRTKVPNLPRAECCANRQSLFRNTKIRISGAQT
jgi:hypothetical protein